MPTRLASDGTVVGDSDFEAAKLQRYLARDLSKLGALNHESGAPGGAPLSWFSEENASGSSVALAPCGLCGQLKGELLEAILENRLANHVVVDARSAGQMIGPMSPDDRRR